MTVSIYGRSYNVKRSALRSDFLNLIMDEDTFLLYVAQNKDQVNDYDTLLAINIECQKVIPMFLSVFNEMVDEYFIPVKYNCPAVYVINVDAANYVVCDKQTISQYSNSMFNKYIGYAIDNDILYICPTLTYKFDAFGTVTKYMQDKPRETQRKTLFEKILPKKEQTSKSEKPVFERPPMPSRQEAPQQMSVPTTPTRSAFDMPKEPTTVQTTPVRRPIFEDFDEPKNIPNIVDIPSTIQPVINKDQSVPKKERLHQYCSYDENCLLVHLVYDDAIAIVNKRNGQTNIVKMDDIVRAIPEYTKQTALMDLGRCITFAYEVKSLKLLDIRSLIRLFEDKKNDLVNKQLITYSNKTLSFALASTDALNERLSIKDFAIKSHREAVSKYNQLKDRYHAFSKHIYFIATNSTCGIIITSGNGKDNQVITFDELYEAFPDCETIGDIMRMFPVEYIIDASHLGVGSFEQVLGVTIVPEKTLTVCGTVYQVKDVKYGYDTRNKCIMATK